MNLLARAISKYRRDGLFAVLKAGFEMIYIRQKYYVLEVPLYDNKFDYMPRVNYPWLVEYAVDGGLAWFRVTTNVKLIHRAGIAFNEEAMRKLKQRPYKVDFANGEVCTGAAWTDPEYQGQGFGTYVYILRLNYAFNKGKVKSRAVITTDNIGSIKMNITVGAYVKAMADYTRFLKFESWEEDPIRICRLKEVVHMFRLYI